VALVSATLADILGPRDDSRTQEQLMSRLGCLCGNIIRDQTDFLPYKGKILRDQHTDQFHDIVAQEIASFIAAISEGKRNKWIEEHFSHQYPLNIDNVGIIHDIVVRHFINQYILDIYQCENCGRIWIQESPTSNQFRSFYPDSVWKETLAVRNDE
jgi:hypothetical protein